METCHNYCNIPTNQNVEKRTLMQSHSGRALYSTFKWKIIIKKFQKNSGKNVFFSFNALNRFLKSLPLRNNFLLHSPLGIINVKTNFYKVVSEKFGIQAASEKYSFSSQYSIITLEV